MKIKRNKKDSITSILYIFGPGRKGKIQNEHDFPQEFFYGYFHFKKIGYETDIIELNPSNKGILNLILVYLDKVLRKITTLPFFMSHLITFKNIKKIIKYKNIVMTLDRAAISLVFPFYILGKLLNKNSLIIVMGLIKRNNNFVIDNLLLKILFSTYSNFAYLGKSEYEEACKRFPKYSNKFHFVPFCIDTSFWFSRNKNLQKKQNEKTILFVGNDGKRDFSHVLKLARENLALNFTIISTNSIFNSVEDLPNVTYLNGSLFNSKISDHDLKEIYKNSSLTIVPLTNSLQPSGQSVTLQSLACGTPVLITKTDGFWDFDSFNDSNISFLNDNSVESWSNELTNLLGDVDKYDKLVKNGQLLILDKYYLELFNKKINSFF